MIIYPKVKCLEQIHGIKIELFKRVKKLESSEHCLEEL